MNSYMQILALQDTFLKKRPVQSSELPDGEKVSVDEGKIYQVDELITPKDGHSLVRLSHGAGEWWVFDEHFAIKGMSISDRGLSLIQEFEGLRLDAYVCPVGVATIGYGTTIYPDGRKVKLGDTITTEQAIAYLKHDVEKFETAISFSVSVPLNQNEFDALVSFVYNVGINAFKTSTLLKKLNSGDRGGAASEFLRWNKAGKKVLPGLTKRRLAEKVLFQSEGSRSLHNAPKTQKGTNTLDTPKQVLEVKKEAFDTMDWKNIDWTDFDAKLGRFFTVGEFLCGDRRRIPTDDITKAHCIRIMQELNELREAFGHPIRITSGYRPHRINLSVGGVSNSRHVVGDAVDIVCTDPNLIQEFRQFCLNNWTDAVGDGIKTRKGFMHLDTRFGGGFKKGAKPRVVWGY